MDSKVEGTKDRSTDSDGDRNAVKCHHGGGLLMVMLQSISDVPSKAA